MPGLLQEQEQPQDEDPTTKKAFPHAAASASAGQNTTTTTGGNAPLPKGVVLDKDGKPCRTCTSSSAWMAMMKSSTSTKHSQPSQPTQTTHRPTHTASFPPPPTPDPSCPPDVETLGTHTWTLLHALTATYPPTPTPIHQSKTSSFLHLFAQLYPCWVCAEDFQTWMKEPQNDPERSGALKSQEGFGRWMCRAHNAVNVKLGKEEFDCDLWRERWKDGWRDGRCD